MNKWFGDKAFYRRTLSLAIPVIIQNGITSFVSLLDNVMVGAVGTESMTGVSICNTLIFVFNLCIFGAVSGAGIFSAQFFGKGDHDGVRHAMRFKLICSIVLSALAICLFIFAGDSLIAAYIEDDGSGLDAALVFSEAKTYLRVILFGLIPFALVQSCAGTLRETGEATLPMIASIAAVLTNLVFNYILIFGHFGAPRLGVAGAAIATVSARVVELLIVYIGAFTQLKSFPFLKGVFSSLYIPGDIVRSIIQKGAPLFANELMWAMGMAIMRKLYSSRGISVLAALNISSTASDLFSVVFISMGTAIAIILGQQLGAGKISEAKQSADWLIVFSVILSIAVGIVMAVLSPFIPLIYRQTGEVHSIASGLLCISAIVMPINAFANATYFTIRSGGKTVITFLFDSGFVWVVSIPVALLICRMTSLPILPFFALCQCLDLVKCVIGFVLVKKGSWARNLVADDEHSAALVS